MVVEKWWRRWWYWWLVVYDLDNLEWWAVFPQAAAATRLHRQCNTNILCFDQTTNARPFTVPKLTAKPGAHMLVLTPAQKH